MSKATLLVVEDEPNLLFGIRDILELDGYRVITARNGQEALTALQATIPDLIISDVMMPQMDGTELLKEIRKREDWVAIPFIFLTAKGEKTDIQNGKILGVDDYLVKPYDAEDLLITVDAKLRRHQAIHQAQNSVVEKIKRNILTILNHEFRTPLTLVVAYADMLKDQDVEAMNEQELLLFLKEINSGADRLRHLIENFIMLVELETGNAQRMFDWRKAKLPDLPTIVREAYDRKFGQPKVQHTCTLDIADTLPPVLGDRAFLVTILCELLDNAIKFSTPDDPITITTGTTEDEVHISVVDNGRGIKDDEIDTIWEMFYQVDRDQFEDQGAGSGLAIVKGLTEIHGGRVEVTSAYGKGSCFTLILKQMSKD